MEIKYGFKDYFSDVETIREHNGYFCSVQESLVYDNLKMVQKAEKI